jgi:DNA-binding MarR family transcriptional regulator
MKNPSPRAIDYQALADFRYEIRRFLNFSERLVRAAGMEPQQHQALLAIKGLPIHRIATIGALAERLLIQHHSAVELVNRLEAKGLLRRARGIADRREVVLTLSRRGEALLKQLTRPHHTELQSARPKLLAALAAAIDPDSATVGARGNARRNRHGKKRRARQKHRFEKRRKANGRRRLRLDGSKA